MGEDEETEESKNFLGWWAGNVTRERGHGKIAEEKETMSFTVNMKQSTVLQRSTFLWLIALGIVTATILTVDFGGTDKMSKMNGVSKRKHGSISSVKQQQIQNYINGSGLMVNIHVTHHGGTYFCNAMKAVGPCPSTGCIGGDNWPMDNDMIWDKNHKGQYPWKFSDTGVLANEVRKYFHMISWEFQTYWNMSQTNWEHPDLLSVAIMRDPLDRFMAGGKCGQYKGVVEKDLVDHPSLSDLYWEYANSDCADNFALKVFTRSPGCCNGGDTSISYLEEAKNQLDRFTILIDQKCESQSIQVMSDLLQLGLNMSSPNRRERLHRHHPPARKRIGNDTLFQFLQNRFKLDIELYEYAKTKSILDCSTVMGL